MQDEMIVDLYWERDENAISETDRKYGRYLSKIAYNILSDWEDSKETVNDTYLKDRCAFRRIWHWWISKYLEAVNRIRKTRR